jgi:hypothetical protein
VVRCELLPLAAPRAALRGEFTAHYRARAGCEVCGHVAELIFPVAEVLARSHRAVFIEASLTPNGQQLDVILYLAIRDDARVFPSAPAMRA